MVFTPLGHEEPLQRIVFQFVTVTFILVCVFIYGTKFAMEARDFDWLLKHYGVVPSYLSGYISATVGTPPWMIVTSPFTAIFLHSSFLQLLGNMMFLWVFGDRIEDSMGHFRFIFLFVVCGLAGTAAYVLHNPLSSIPLVGANGAIGGIFGAFIILHPTQRITLSIVGPTPAWVFGVIWVAYQAALAYGVMPEQIAISRGGAIAWEAYLGGFIAGCLLVIPLRSKELPLFDKL